MWTRLFWTALLVFVILWDVSTYLFGPLDFAHVFGAGLATGMIVSGFIGTAARSRHGPPPL